MHSRIQIPIALTALLAVVLIPAGRASAIAVQTSLSLSAGWNLVSLPLAPVNPDPAAVFKNNLGQPIAISGNLHRYDPLAHSYRTYYSATPAEFGDAQRGVGYWLWLSSPTRISYQAYSATSVKLPLITAGWHLMGTPKSSAVPLSEVEVVHEGLGRTASLDDAITTERWLDGRLYWYDTVAHGYSTCGFEGWNARSSIESWKGYWVHARTGPLSIVIPFAGLPPADFIDASDGRFWLDGEQFGFVGANIRGLAHYGEGDVLPYSQTSDRATSCSALRNEMKGRVARIFVASRAAVPAAIAARLQATVNVARTYDVYLIVCFTDMYNASQMYVRGDDGYYTVPGAGYAMLNHDFWSSGYNVNYLPLVQYLVGLFKDEPRIFSWELGNEIRDLSSATTFISFCNTVHDTIRALDPNHMISVGTSRPMAGFSYSQASTLYASRFDFLVGHPYNGEDWEDDTGLANDVGKPFVVEEAGFSSITYSDRPARTDADVAKWMGRGARGYMQWGLMATTYDNGDGDGVFGVDRALHADWNQYMQVYSAWGNSL